VDSSTDLIRNHGYLKNHWKTERYFVDIEKILVKPTPLRIGENDVDTVLHLVLAHHAGSSVFEGMCNPPGGDWSGVSLQLVDRSMELRWLTLPRVSNINAKRPDHVFQIFNLFNLPIILSIESKETAASVENNIGPRLISYISELIQTPASVIRKTKHSTWIHSDTSLNESEFLMASAVAFKADSDIQITQVENRANTDLLISLEFTKGGEHCYIKLIPSTNLGGEIAKFMESITLDSTNISVIVLN
jgi:hypothetical protein